jgi:hypothetical protein
MIHIRNQRLVIFWGAVERVGSAPGRQCPRAACLPGAHDFALLDHNAVVFGRAASSPWVRTLPRPKESAASVPERRSRQELASQSPLVAASAKCVRVAMSSARPPDRKGWPHFVHNHRLRPGKLARGPAIAIPNSRSAKRYRVVAGFLRAVASARAGMASSYRRRRDSRVRAED